MSLTGAPFGAVLFDFGGVILSSPFDAFADYERRNDLPPTVLRSINATNPDGNAWARFERGDVDAEEFDRLFAEESEARGHRVAGREVLALIQGTVRPRMVEVLRRVNDLGYVTACLTNNFHRNDGADVAGGHGRPEVDAVMALFDHVVESSKVGVRKPERRFYEIALELVGEPAERCVFLDDLGVNLKPAKAMGMTTIKVTDPDAAIAELGTALGITFP